MGRVVSTCAEDFTQATSGAGGCFLKFFAIKEVSTCELPSMDDPVYKVEGGGQASEDDTDHTMIPKELKLFLAKDRDVDSAGFQRSFAMI